MFKAAVFNLKDIKKYLFCLVIVITMIYMANRYFFSHKSYDKNINLFSFIEEKAVVLIDTQYPQIKRIAENNKNDIIVDENAEEDSQEKFLVGLITTQIGIAKEDFNNKDKNSNLNSKDQDIGYKMDEENSDMKEDNTDDEENEQDFKNIEGIKSDVDTEVVTKSPLADAYTDMYGSVKIKNETSYTLSDDVLNPEGIDIDSKNILIFHTHTCESYTSSDIYPYTPTGSYRTTDLNYSVARVGDELEGYLKSFGFNVRHNKTYHDYPAYTGSYSRSLATVQGLLEEEKSDIIIDLHRDAIGSRPDYAPTVRIGDEYAAQIMFVMGSNGGGLYHPNWSSNLKFAVKVQEVANQMYPGLCKPIIFRNSRYNQHLGKAACIIEVGSTGNTLEQTLVSMKYLASVLDSVLLR